MKRILLYLFAVSFIVFPCFSQTGIESLLQKQNLKSALEMIRNPAKSEEVLVQLLFSMPPEYHQYVMPMVADTYGISEKTRMMPGIVEWRGKLPTRIAPELEDYAREHLRYLDPRFYPMLMPEAWSSYGQKEKGRSQKVVAKYIDISSPEARERVFPSSIQKGSALEKMFSLRLEQDLSMDPNALTDQDVVSVLNVFDKVKSLEIGVEGRKRRAKLVMKYLDNDVLLDAIGTPCHALFSDFNKIQADKWLALQVRKEGMTVPEYINKCDRVIKAFRFQQTTPALLTEVLRLNKEKVKLKKGSYDRRIAETLAKMFQTTRGDVKALKGKEELLEKTLKERLLILGTPILLDF